MDSQAEHRPKTGEVSPDEALKWFQTADLASLPPYFLTHWKTNKSFFVFKGCLLAFEKTKSQFIVTGEPAVTASADTQALYKTFLNFAHRRKKKVSGYYVGTSWENASFSKKPLGTSFRVHLDTYKFNVSKTKEVRRSLRKGISSGYKILDSSEIDLIKLKALLLKWRSKKLPVKLKFFLSEPQQNSTVAEYEKWYVIEKNEQYFAFCSTLPYRHDGREGYYLDHLAYDPSSEKSALSFLISSLIQDLKKKGAKEINLGLNPFAKIAPKDITSSLFSCLYHMPFLYRPKGLHYFKSKFAGLEEAEFFFYEKKASPLLTLIDMTKAALKK